MKTETVLIGAAVLLLLMSSNRTAQASRPATTTVSTVQAPLWQRIGLPTLVGALTGIAANNSTASTVDSDSFRGIPAAPIQGDAFWTWESNFFASPGDPDPGTDYAGTAANPVTNARARH